MKVKVRKVKIPPMPGCDALLEYCTGRISREEYVLRMVLLGKERLLQPQRPEVPHKLTPSPGGRECLGNGTWVGYECQCPDCDWYQTICFTERS